MQIGRIQPPPDERHPPQTPPSPSLVSSSPALKAAQIPQQAVPAARNSETAPSRSMQIPQQPENRTPLRTASKRPLHPDARRPPLPYAAGVRPNRAAASELVRTGMNASHDSKKRRLAAQMPPAFVSPPPASLTPRSPSARPLRRILQDMPPTANSPTPAVGAKPASPALKPRTPTAACAASPSVSSAFTTPTAPSLRPPRSAQKLHPTPITRRSSLPAPPSARHPRKDAQTDPKRQQIHAPADQNAAVQNEQQPAMSHEERIAMWRNRFMTYTIYLSGFEHSLAQKIAAQIRTLGASIAPFLSAQVTHFVSAEPIDASTATSPSTRARAAREPNAAFGLRSSAKDSAVIARRLNCKIWPYSKLEKIIQTLLPTQPRADLEGRLEQERISRASGRSATSAQKLVFRPFESYYLLVQDVTGNHCPVFGEQFEQQTDTNRPPWPVIYFKTHSTKAVFAPQSYPTTAADEEETQNDENESENLDAGDGHPALDAQQTPRTPRQRHAQSNAIQDAETLIATPQHANAHHDHHNVHSGCKSDATRIQPLSIASGLISGSTFKNILRRDPLDDPKIAKMGQRSFAPAAGQISVSAQCTEPSRSKSSTPRYAKHEPKDNFASNRHMKSQSHASNYRSLHKRDRNGVSKSKHRSQSNRNHRMRIVGMQFYNRPGYCENCFITYDSYCDHVVSDKHRTWASNPQNFVGIDSIIDATRRCEILDVMDPFEPYEICRRDEPIVINDGADYAYVSDGTHPSHTEQIDTHPENNHTGNDTDDKEHDSAHSHQDESGSNKNNGDAGILTTGTLVLVQTRDTTDSTSQAYQNNLQTNPPEKPAEAVDDVSAMDADDNAAAENEIDRRDAHVESDDDADRSDETIVRHRRNQDAVATPMKANGAVSDSNNAFDLSAKPIDVFHETTPAKICRADPSSVNVTPKSSIVVQQDAMHEIASPIQKGVGLEHSVRRLYFDHSYTAASIQSLMRQFMNEQKSPSVKTAHLDDQPFPHPSNDMMISKPNSAENQMQSPKPMMFDQSTVMSPPSALPSSMMPQTPQHPVQLVYDALSTTSISSHPSPRNATISHQPLQPTSADVSTVSNVDQPRERCPDSQPASQVSQSQDSQATVIADRPPQQIAMDYICHEHNSESVCDALKDEPINPQTKNENTSSIAMCVDTSATASMETHDPSSPASTSSSVPVVTEETLVSPYYNDNHEHYYCGPPENMLYVEPKRPPQVVRVASIRRSKSSVRGSSGYKFGR